MSWILRGPGRLARGNVPHMAYSRNLGVDVKVPYADRVGNLLVGVGLLVIGGALDTLG